MSQKFDPTPRPALRKAPDADVHPTTHIAPPSTGDAVLEGKKVSLEVRVPKKLRKQLRSAAKDADSTVDDIVTAAIASELRRRSQ
jgi:hypothetical protein